MANKAKTKPELSIILSLRNTKECNRGVHRLSDFLESLKGQTAKGRFEIIVSDIDSDPEFKAEHKKVCQKFRVRYFFTFTGKPWNISRAKNIGIQQVKADYVMATDIDCIFAPDFIEKILKHLEPNKIIHCRVYELPEKYDGKLDDWEKMKKVSILRPRHGYGTCQIIERAWAMKVKGYDEKYILWGAEDTDFYLRAMQDKKEVFWLEDETSYFHQWHPQSNRFENSDQLAKNRTRVRVTQKGFFPIFRNDQGWGRIQPKTDVTIAKETCVLITTFLRDDLLFKCIESIRKYYPDIAVFVGDNGRITPGKREFCEKNRCILLEFPFDIGVSETRNRSLNLIPDEFQYVFITEEDIIFTEDTKFETLKKILDSDPNIGIAGGLLKRSELQEQHYEGMISIEGDAYRIRQVGKQDWKRIDNIKYFLCDIILNVFMAKRSIFDSVKWDKQFKTTFEHSDFFLRMKYESDENQMPIFKDGKPAFREKPIKVAYSPDVSMLHPKAIEGNEYSSFRSRSEGRPLFNAKWKVSSSDSEFEIKPVLAGMENPFQRAKQRNLESAIEILKRHNCKWWLSLGTCLGAVREGDFILHDMDIDIGLPEAHLDLWDAFIEEFTKVRFRLYKEWTHEGKRMELSFMRDGIRLDFFFFFRKGDRCWHGAFGPDKQGKWGNNMIFLPHVFSAGLFEILKEISFNRMKCFIPNPPEKYLKEVYGQDWKTPKKDYKYWTDCKAISPSFIIPQKITFIPGVWDLFHVGHLNILEKSKKLGGRLIVGVLTDAAVQKYKTKPVIPYEQRRRIIESLKVVDEVMEENDSDATEDLKRLGIEPTYLVHGDDWDKCPGNEYVRNRGGKTIFFPYTKEVNSSLIKEKIKEKDIEPAKAKEVRAGIAIVIKTFMRESSLFRCVDSMLKNCPKPFRIYIADDSHVSIDKRHLYHELKQGGHRIIELPFDVGISVGRNAAMSEVKEDYVLVMDDDIMIKNAETVKKLKDILDADPNLGLVAGYIENENGVPFGSDKYSTGLRFEIDNRILFRWPASAIINKLNGSFYRQADQVVNFFLARKELFNDVKWDDRIHIEWEHIDFFLELAKTKWKAAVCLDAKAIHMKSNYDREYESFRRSASNQYFFNKHDIVRVINRF